MTVNDELPPRRWLDRLARHQPLLLPLLSGLLAVLLALGFVMIAGLMLAGDTHGLDMLLLRAAQAWRAEHPWLAEAMRDITAFGSTAGLVLVTTVTVFYLLLVGRRGSGWLVAASVLSGTLVMSLLKLAFNRARPDPAFAELIPWLRSTGGTHERSCIPREDRRVADRTVVTARRRRSRRRLHQGRESAGQPVLAQPRR